MLVTFTFQNILNYFNTSKDNDFKIFPGISRFKTLLEHICL